MCCELSVHWINTMSAMIGGEKPVRFFVLGTLYLYLHPPICMVCLKSNITSFLISLENNDQKIFTTPFETEHNINIFHVTCWPG